MAAPGTLTHVLEVATQLATVTDAHAAALLEQATTAAAEETAPHPTGVR